MLTRKTHPISSLMLVVFLLLTEADSGAEETEIVARATQITNSLQKLESSFDSAIFAETFRQIDGFGDVGDQGRKMWELKAMLLLNFVGYCDRVLDGIVSNGIPVMNSAPPFGDVLDSGVNPEALTDPQARAAYVSLLAKEKEIATRFLYRHRILALRNSGVQKLEEFVRVHFKDVETNALRKIVGHEIPKLRPEQRIDPWTTRTNGLLKRSGEVPTNAVRSPIDR